VKGAVVKLILGLMASWGIALAAIAAMMP